jgi:hypothetical protein
MLAINRSPRWGLQPEAHHTGDKPWLQNSKTQPASFRENRTPLPLDSWVMPPPSPVFQSVSI